MVPGQCSNVISRVGILNREIFQRGSNCNFLHSESCVKYFEKKDKKREAKETSVKPTDHLNPRYNKNGSHWVWFGLLAPTCSTRKFYEYCHILN